MKELRIGNLMDKYRSQIVCELQNLVRIPSVRGEAVSEKPFGPGPANALKYILELAASWGLQTENVDGYAGHVDYGDTEEYVAVLVHLDVVPEGFDWSYPPFEAMIRNNMIYGRGVSDDKGPAVAALFALKAMQDAHITTKRKIRVIFGCAEETGMEDMDHYFTKYPLPYAAFTPDVEYPVINREKGILQVLISAPAPIPKKFILLIEGGDAMNKVPDRCKAIFDASLMDDQIKNTVIEMITALGPQYGEVSLSTREFIIETFGKSSHGATPELGVNAIMRMIAICQRIHEKSSIGKLLDFFHESIGFETEGATLGIACHDEESGKLSLNVGIIRMHEKTLEIGFDIRYPVTVDGKRIIDHLESLVREQGFEMTIENHLVPLFLPVDHPLITSLRKAYSMYNDTDPEPDFSSGGTYARVLNGKGVAFGGVGEHAHEPDECVDIDQLMTHSSICAQAMYEMGMMD